MIYEIRSEGGYAKKLPDRIELLQGTLDMLILRTLLLGPAHGHEIGIRMALGASRWNVFWLVGRQGMTAVLLGIAVGTGCALALGRLLATMLYRVRPADPATFAAASLGLAGIGLLATYLPARRAARRDTLAALRYE